MTPARLSVFALLLLAAVASLRHPLVDTDLWWHLKTGEWILANGAVPWQDPFSYTAAGHLWIAYSWLAEIVFYGLFRAFGIGAVLELKTIVVVAMTALLYLACRAAGARRPAAVVTSALAAMASTGGWGERPQIFTLLLLALLSWLIWSPRLRQHLLWAAPLTVALWANLHILFIAGIALVTLAAVSAAWEGEASGRLFAAAVLAAVASLANPYGWKLHQHLPTMAMQPRIVRAVSEFQSPDFASPLGILAGAFLFYAIAAFAISRARPRAYELVTFFGSLAMALYMVRNLALFSILSAPIVARHLESALPAADEDADRPVSSRLRALHLAVVAAGLALVVSLLPPRKPWQELVEPGAFPIAAADFVAAHPPNARVFTHFNWGGFLIFRSAPASQVSMDGRTQVYGQELLRSYLRTQYVLEGWESFLEKGDPDVVLWPAKDPLANVLRKLPPWRVLYEDDTAVVFAKSDASVQ